MVDFKTVYNYSKDLNVLYVEDNAEVRESTSEMLEVYFSSLDIAEDGLDGVEKYKAYFADNANYYDLVISDIEMPRLNGIELSDAILEMNQDQMILIFSAYSEPEYLFELINLGVSSFLNKPIKVNQLNRSLLRVTRVVSNRKAELERREYEKEEREFLQSVMDLQDNFIIITDGRETKSANQSVLDFFGFESLDEFKQAHTCICNAFIEDSEHFHLGLLDKETLWIEHILNNEEKDFTVLMQNAVTGENESFKVSVNYFRSKNRYIVTFSNITNMTLMNKTIKYKATYDALTGIYNRQSLYDLLGEYFSQKAEETSLVLVMFDVDHFKMINDTHGHLNGDIVLKQLVSVIKNNIRDDDVFARWGGEEFVLVFENLTLENALKVSENLRLSVEQSTFEAIGSLTCSFGVTAYSEGDTIDKLINRADMAMYEAKRSGRNKICHA
ncbi:MAG: diguanylate cyclase [Campylobacterota bacterium]